MRIYPISKSFILMNEDIEPYRMLNEYYDDGCEIRKRKLFDILISTFTPLKHNWIKGYPALVSDELNDLAALLIAVYDIHEKRLYKTSKINNCNHRAKHLFKMIQEDAELDEDSKEIPISLGYGELKNPYKVFKLAFGRLSLEQWLTFLKEVNYECLNFKQRPGFFEISHQVACSLLLFKIIDAAYLISN